MKSLRIAVAVTVVLSSVVPIVRAAPTLVNVQIKALAYNSISDESAMDVTPFTQATLISECTSEKGAALCEVVGDSETNGTMIVTVDPCGVILCTNLVMTTLCDQIAITSNGRSETDLLASHEAFSSPSNLYTGDGFLLTTGVCSPTDSTAITGYSGKGTITLCQSDGAVITGTITLKGLFKKAKDCP
ncbi:MAG TPA: hypothetical protein VMV72_19810 [Verrucomicrobiae bacterium]|nr:hypothetical protein [Verrucomicrobiae bacterium]